MSVFGSYRFAKSGQHKLDAKRSRFGTTMCKNQLPLSEGRVNATSRIKAANVEYQITSEL